MQWRAHALGIVLLTGCLACSGADGTGGLGGDQPPGDGWNGSETTLDLGGLLPVPDVAASPSPDAPEHARDGEAADGIPTVDTGEGEICGYGTIYGLVCDSEAQVFIGGASVMVDATDCNGAEVRRMALSDHLGYFTLSGVPAGLQTVQVRKGGLAYEITAIVEDGQLTDITAEGREACAQASGGDDQCVKGQDSIPVGTPLTSAQADIIWFIDTSNSMEAEANWLQQNINAFAQYIGSQQIDYHVILIAEGYDLCVPPPLGGPSCSDGPRFRHVHQKVDSNDGLEQVIATYPEYSDFLRERATTNFVAVSDDNSDRSAAWFRAEMANLPAPGFSDPFVFHSIVAYGSLPVIGCITGAFMGLVYLELTADTGGAQFPICRTDWGAIFQHVAETVVETVQSTCSFALPDPERAAAADLMTLAHISAGHPTIIPRVFDAGDCGPQGGWHIDDTTEPPSLVLCPATCTSLTGEVLQLAYDCLE